MDNSQKLTVLTALTLEFFEILETTEVSDFGRKFHPTTISSCRCMDSARLGEILPRMKELAGQLTEK